MMYIRTYVHVPVCVQKKCTFNIIIEYGGIILYIIIMYYYCGACALADCRLVVCM